MSKPKTEIDQKEYFKEIHFLYEIINNLKNVEEIKPFLKDILTSSELRMLKRRWHIANLISQGFDIRTIANLSQTSTQTVSKIKQIMEDGNGGYDIAIDRVNEIMKKETQKKKRRGGSKFVKTWFD